MELLSGACPNGAFVSAVTQPQPCTVTQSVRIWNWACLQAACCQLCWAWEQRVRISIWDPTWRADKTTSYLFIYFNNLFSLQFTKAFIWSDSCGARVEGGGLRAYLVHIDLASPIGPGFPVLWGKVLSTCPSIYLTLSSAMEEQATETQVLAQPGVIWQKQPGGIWGWLSVRTSSAGLRLPILLEPE